MGRYILRRLLQLIPVFIGTTFIIYALVWALPGNPFAGKCGARSCPQAYIDKMTEQYNLNEPVIVQYFLYLGKLLTGNFGETYSGTEVGTLIQNAYPVTVKLALVALIIEGVIGIAAGVLTALRGKGFLDNLVLASTLVLISVPVFVTGFILQIVLGVQLEWIQPSVGSDPTIGELFVPGFVLGSLSMAYIARLSRTAMMENKRADYIRTATAKGLAPRRVVGIHMLRNSLIPVITFIGTDFGALMGGAIVTEGVFNIHGIGGLIFEAIMQQEGTTVTGVVTLLVIVYLLMNLLVDILYAALDPRIRYD
ncbi:oligopeptide transport system permease protein [Halopolyspora algeriensis]|uniref:Oligopeptide transport system permease protein n=1 Tax=Halopolyspora algeriensis TaxID=1500506 RepID=A0A368VFI4_9ACTN|nr:ABC transporter permease [Halopolyspora algeriensis]RCW39983.1 oligopeptide transport system permease protein [Halopolyspora algeriensis]TQM46580.1 oligopeptide transport system permease protein [Halopolyspora algeriensis]